MKIFKACFPVILMLFTVCDPGKEEKTKPIIKRTVYLIKDTFVVHSKKNSDTSYLEFIFKNNNLVDIQSLDTSIRVNLRYADTNNFLKKDFYDGLRKAYFPCEMAIKVCNAQHFLKKINKNYSLLILDATRPLHVQQMMWDSLDMPPDRKFNYLAAPYSNSLHNYGCAVDATIIDLISGEELNMGTGFDSFGKLSEPVYEWRFLKSGELTREAYKNRNLLRQVMRLAQLNPINSEWWHFNCGTKEYAAANFKLIK